MEKDIETMTLNKIHGTVITHINKRKCLFLECIEERSGKRLKISVVFENRKKNDWRQLEFAGISG